MSMDTHLIIKSGNIILIMQNREQDTCRTTHLNVKSLFAYCLWPSAHLIQWLRIYCIRLFKWTTFKENTFKAIRWPNLFSYAKRELQDVQMMQLEDHQTSSIHQTSRLPRKCSRKVCFQGFLSVAFMIVRHCKLHSTQLALLSSTIMWCDFWYQSFMWFIIALSYKNSNKF